ncbi:kanadaptin-like isoform X2 [Homarus americanus]|uniref:kanadaptin-like isoform X2 n=1 Tax=Homarus americanus TaxID=6706 RepID=UPI001C47B55A|nr:kanadaptin-like isoform X2 [Homarus americanus]
MEGSPVKTVLHGAEDISHQEVEDVLLASKMETITPSNNDSDTFESVTTISKERDFKAPADIPFKKPFFISKNQRLNTNQDERKSKEKEERESKLTIIESPHTEKLQEKSPAQKLTEKSVPLPYKEPTWSGLPIAEYSFEVLKNGIIVDTIPLNKPFTVIGRLAQCDIVLEHPSLSRFHCVIQYRLEGSETKPQGFYAYDLGSTHGSFHNKHQMKPHTYYLLRVGHLLKLGGSTRMLILQGPAEDQEPESDLTVTELKDEALKRARKLKQLEIDRMEEENGEQKMKESDGSGKTQEDIEGVDWGIGEDAEEEAEEGDNPFASLNEDLYLEDPKKTLRGWFEREGYDLPNYVIEDISPGFYKCKVELPGPGGIPLIATVEHKGKKKEVVIQCALEACKLLDRQGVLRQAKHESHQRKKRDWAENDYYDSDEDDFLDRTGDVQRKRIRRMKDAGGKDSAFVENYDTLITKYKEVLEELVTLEGKLNEADFLKQASESSNGADDDLDSFMHKLKSQVPDKHKRVTWKLRVVDLRKDELRLRRLTNIARPLGVPELQPYHSKYASSIKQNSRSASLGERQKGSLGTSLASTRPKEPSFKPHKIFLEEEQEEKPRLRRLDDDDKLPTQIPPTSSFKSKHLTQEHDVIEKSDSAIPVTSKVNKTQKHEHKSVSVLLSEDEHTISMLKTVKTPEQDLHEVETREKSGSDARNNKNENILHCLADINSQESNNINKTETGNTNKYTNDWKRPNTPEISSPKNSKCDGSEESPFEKKPRIIGPSLPLHLAHIKTEYQNPTKTKKRQDKKGRKYDEDSPNYDSWTPPNQQSGDGRTSLNDKFGY